MKRDVVIDSDWVTTLFMVVLLAISLAVAAVDLRSFKNGRAGQSVSVATLLWAGACFMATFSRRAKRDENEAAERGKDLAPLERGGFFLFGVGASIRAAAFYLHAPDAAQHLAGRGAQVLDILAGVMVLISTIQWFRRVVRLRKKQAHAASN